MKIRKNLIKMLAYLLCFAMLATLTVFTVGAETSGADTVDYTLITNEAELRAVYDNLEGNYKLANDITLTVDWAPIQGFKGIFDGNGFDIHDLYLEDVGTSNYARVGFFGTLESGAVVKNLAVHGTIKNDYWAKTYVGGIVGEMMTGSTVENCFSDVDITFGILSHNAYVGGIVGVVFPGVTIKNCINEGDIAVDSDPSSAKRHWIGGIAGYVQGVEEGDTLIENCVNRGALSVTKNCEADTYIAGIAGNISHDKGTVTITRCVNFGAISGVTRYVAGIAGGHKYDLVDKGKVDISYCSNFGEITCTNGSGTNYVGGIFGRGVWATGSTVTNCYNAGKVSAPVKGVGAIAGDDLNVTCKNCVSVSVENVTGSGLFGLDEMGTVVEGCEVIGNNTTLTDVVTKLNGTLETAVFKLENGAIAQTYHVFVASEDTVLPPQSGGNNNDQQGGNNDQQGGNNDQQGGNNNDQQGENNDETNAPETKAPETNALVDEEASGCKSVVSSALAVMLCIGATGVMITRRKH